MLKDYVVSRIDPSVYYVSRFPRWRKGENIRCPFHEDTKPSMALALNNGGAKCHASSCQMALGNIVHFESELKGITESEAALSLYRELIRPLIPYAQIKEYQQAFRKSAEWRRIAIRDLGLTYINSRRFGIGVDTRTRRFTFPVYDQWGNCVNIRHYRPPTIRKSWPTDVKVHNEKGFGKLDLFPWNEIRNYTANKPIFIMASEKEAMLAIQHGFQAVSTTAGEGSWLEEWNSIVAGYRIGIVMDNDAGGLAAEKRLARQLATVAKEVRVVRLPYRKKSSTDYADYVLKERGDPKKISLCFNGADHPSPPPSEKPAPVPEGEGGSDDFPELPNLIEGEVPLSSISSRVGLLNQRIRVQGIVAAKAQRSFMVPWRFRIKIKNRPEIVYSLPMGRELLSFVQSSDLQIRAQLSKLIGTPKIAVTPTDYLPVSEVELIPTAVVDQDVPYVVQRCFYFGQRIEANVPYSMEIVPTSHVGSQETIGLIVKIEPLARTMDNFNFSDPNLQQLQIFQPSEFETVWEKLETIVNEISVRFTRIYNRPDWHLVALLTWASPLAWRFPNDTRMQRGWLNTLALGDTETGKSEVVRALQQLFGVGSIVNSENCTFVGLVGGCIKSSSGQFMLRWGRIPICDKQLVVLEELSGLSVEEISNLSDVRSSGIARLDKGGLSSETNARTRLICLSNVRPQRRTLASYLSGVQAVQELVGHGEDIARFDFITTLIDSEVPVEVINDSSPRHTHILLKQESLRQLIQFIWSLKPNQIEFTSKAYQQCLNQTKKLSCIYHPAVPIFKGGSGRYKLGRIAAAIACLQFAWTGDRIRVEESHVAAAARLLRTLYEKPSLGYRKFSEQLFDRDKIKDVQLLDKIITTKIPSNRLGKVMETLIHSAQFTADEFCAVAGVSRFQVDQLIGVMVRERALRKGQANIWELTVAGAEFLSRYIK